MIIRTLPTPLNLHVLFAPWCIPLSEPWPLTAVGHMHLFSLYAIIKATSPMSLIASLVASSNLFGIILYLSIAVLFAGNKSTTTTTTTLAQYSLAAHQSHSSTTAVCNNRQSLAHWRKCSFVNGLIISSIDHFHFKMQYSIWSIFLRLGIENPRILSWFSMFIQIRVGQKWISVIRAHLYK